MIQRAASLNLTNAVPKRVLQISSQIEEILPVDQICWQRFPRGNFDKAILIAATGLIQYARKLHEVLMKQRYRVLLFDDLRLLPLAVLIKKRTGATLVYNRQEVPTVDAAQALSKRLPISFARAHKIVEAIETRLARHVDAVFSIPLSVEGNARLQAWGPPVVSFMNVPELPIAKLKVKKQSDAKEALLIYSGAISKENGLLAYLRLIKRLKQKHTQGGMQRRTCLLLIGRLWKITPQELDELIERQGCTGLVEVRQWIPYDELQSVLANADVGLALADPMFEKHKHMGEGASRKIFTYMAVGLPVVAGGAFGQIIANAGAGHTIDFDDDEALVEAVLEIISSIDTAKTMSKRGVAAIEQSYNWDIERKKIAPLLRRTIN